MLAAHRSFALLAASLSLSLSTALIAAPQAKAAKGSKKQAAPAEIREWATGEAIPKIQLDRVLPLLPLVRPIQTLQLPGDSTNLYIVEQPGRILLADPSKSELSEASVFLDIKERVNDGGNEEGLLSVAFHPQFPAKRELYVYYTANKPRRSILSRFTVSEDGKSADPTSEEVLLTQAQPYSNHNGGTVLFGPDGFVYLSFGDGGAANDPHHNGQNLGTLLAKVIRIDVSKKGADGAPYAVPTDNPFVGKADAKPEIWALGLRNIWRMSFDSKTGALWGGDVGQNEWEEIVLIEKAGNYGWNAREGFHAFGGGEGTGPFIEPIAEHSHREALSITGGVVYRGQAIPKLEGVYVYADFAFSTIWGIRMVDGKPTKPAVIGKKSGELVTSIDAMQDGTILFSTFNRGQDKGNPGSLWKVVAGSQ